MGSSPHKAIAALLGYEDNNKAIREYTAPITLSCDLFPTP
jgi:hypothetical protein